MPRQQFWLFLILLAACALRVHALGAKSLWYDELRQIEVAQHRLADFPPELAKHSARPLDYVLTHYLLRAGQQEFWLRFPAALWGILSTALMFPLARRWRIADRRTALIAAALMAAAPIGVQYSQELRPYALYLLFTLISFVSLERTLAPTPGHSPAGIPDRGGESASPPLFTHSRNAPEAKQSRVANMGWGFWALFALASAGGMLSHYFYAFVLAAQAIFVIGLFALRKLRWPQFAAFAGSALAGYAAAFVAASPFTLLVFAQKYLGVLVQLPVTGLITDTGLQVVNPDTLNVDFFLKGLLPAYGAGSGAALVVFNGLALIGLTALALRDRRALAQFLLWLLLAPAWVLIYLQYRQQFFANRYVLFALPVYLLVIAHGLASVTRLLPVRRIALAAGLLILIAFDASLVAADYGAPKDDWRRVGAFLTANARAGDAVAAPDVQFFIRFYAPGQPGSIVDANDVGPHEEALDNAERFWFVWSDYTLIPIEETRQWVKGLPGVTFELDPRIKVIFIHPGLTPAEMQAEAARFVIPPPSGR